MNNKVITAILLTLSTYFVNVRAQVVIQVPADYEKKYAISSKCYSEISEFIEGLAKEYSFEIVKPIGDIALSDGVKFIIALRSSRASDKQSKLYCMTIDNVKDTQYLYLKGFSGACTDKSSYDSFSKKLSSKLSKLELL